MRFRAVSPQEFLGMSLVRDTSVTPLLSSSPTWCKICSNCQKYKDTNELNQVLNSSTSLCSALSFSISDSKSSRNIVSTKNLDMGKKSKGPKVTTVTNKKGETVQVFETLEDFETFIKQETEDDEFDHIHCVLNYYPPFVLQHSHNDPEKISEQNNCHSKKFVRHLHQHVEKHLLKDLAVALQSPDLKFGNKSKDQSFEKVVWLYNDDASYHDKPFHVAVEVTARHDDALVNVDYRTTPRTIAV